MELSDDDDDDDDDDDAADGDGDGSSASRHSRPPTSLAPLPGPRGGEVLDCLPGTITERQFVSEDEEGSGSGSECGTDAWLHEGKERRRRLAERDLRRNMEVKPQRWPAVPTAAAAAAAVAPPRLHRASRLDASLALQPLLPPQLSRCTTSCCCGSLEEHLQELDDADHQLQWLLWRLGCTWSMMPHQPKSVRFCAGVPEGWPAGPAPHAAPPAQALRGCTLADDMGLGKTYSSIGGMLVREYVATLRGTDLASVSTLLIVPNVPVLDQWLVALHNSGVTKQQVLRFTGDFTRAGLEAPSLRGRPLPRVVILRKHQLQSEQQGVFNHVALPAVVSGLTPHASKHVEIEMLKAYEADKGRKVKGSKFGKADPGALCALATKAPQQLQP